MDNNNNDYSTKDAIKAVTISATLILLMWGLSFIIK